MSRDLRSEVFTVIRNAVRVGKESVDVKKSKLILAIVKILKQEGYLRDYREIDDGKQGIIRIYLRYTPDKKCVLTDIQPVSTPGRRVYVKKDDKIKVLSGYGIAIISTPQGILTDREAKKRKLGGEYICKVW
ncbi:MAG: 30S ribosomal protein S8 [Candidatus Omnitrophica bacterium]|nr:30S ribosomal protein S8 [Candidatus Omnitrophota bacterium]MCM8798081.1 30S ribosomal protein S8 [Candidatus Omnitrophota bacterium]